MNSTIDLQISGSSAMPGGEYGQVHISGSGKINGNLKCESLYCSGAAKIYGNTETQSISCSGAVSIEGGLVCNTAMKISGSGKCSADVEVETMKISGRFKTGGALKARDMKVSGSIQIDESLQCERLEVSGQIQVKGGVEAETVYLSGSTEISGLLNAEDIRIDHCGTSKIEEIGCTTICVHPQQEKGGFFRFFSSRKIRPALEVGTIEADQVELIETTAKVVRGRDVVIGHGCSIDRVEFTNSCRSEKDTVKEQVKIS